MQTLDPSRDPEDGLCLSVAIVNNNVVGVELQTLIAHEMRA